MSTRNVTNVRRNANGVITHLCNPGSNWWWHTAEKVIEHIEKGKHIYKTKVFRFPKAEIHVRKNGQIKYLATNWDDDEENNLDYLDKCDNCICGQ